MGGINYGGKKGGGITFSKPKEEKKRAIKFPPGPPNLERDTEIELNELQKDFRDRALKEKQMKHENTDTEHFMCIVFANKAQRDQFAELLSITQEDNQYINGPKLIKALQLRIDTLEKNSPGKFKVNKEIANLALDISFYSTVKL